MLLGLAQIIGTAVYAFAANGPGHVASATQRLWELKVEDVDYELGIEDRFKVERVTFKVDDLPRDADININLSPDGPWFTCKAADTRVSCETPGATAEGATRFSVVIAE